MLDTLRDLSTQPVGWSTPLGLSILPRPMDVLGLSLSVVSGASQAASMMMGLSGMSALVGPLADSSEFQNQLHGMECFASPARYAPVEGTETLGAWIERIGKLSFDDRPWVAEGAAYWAAEEAFRHGPGRGWLKVAYPQWCLTVLHTGLGMALAERTLAGASSEAELAKAISVFCSLCVANSKVGYEGCAFECLGLIVRNLHASKVPVIDRLLKSGASSITGAGLREYFWHGYGRGMYFLPGNLTPWAGSGARTIEAASSHAPDEIARNNAVSGASWAFTLVNLRNPRVLSGFLAERGAPVWNNAAFANGVRSALTIWRQIQDDDPAYSALCAAIPVTVRPRGERFAPTGPVFRFCAPEGGS